MWFAHCFFAFFARQAATAFLVASVSMRALAVAPCSVFEALSANTLATARACSVFHCCALDCRIDLESRDCLIAFVRVKAHELAPNF
jgi:hypothetical protein